jgi:hypothetical protein
MKSGGRVITSENASSLKMMCATTTYSTLLITSFVGIAVQNIYSANNNHSQLLLQPFNNQQRLQLYIDDSVIKELLCMQT